MRPKNLPKHQQPQTYAVQRRYERYFCEMGVWLRVDQSNTEYQLAEVVNMGAGGILCLLEYEFDMGDALDISIHIPQREGMLTVHGEVRHKRPCPEGGFYLGIQFNRVEGMSVTAFMAYIEAMFV